MIYQNRWQLYISRRFGIGANVENMASKPRTNFELKYKLDWLICYTYC